MFTLYICWSNGFHIMDKQYASQEEAQKAFNFLVSALPRSGECWVECWHKRNLYSTSKDIR